MKVYAHLLYNSSDARDMELIFRIRNIMNIGPAMVLGYFIYIIKSWDGFRILCEAILKYKVVFCL